METLLGGQVNADWAITDNTNKAFIKNKPDLTVYATKKELETECVDKINQLNTALKNGFTTASLTVSGETSVPTPSTENNSKTIANTEFVHGVVNNLVNGAPEALDTLQELSKALGDDPNFSTTMLNKIGEKADKTAVPTKISQLTNDSNFAIKKSESDANGLLNALSAATTVPGGNDYYISQYVNGGTANTSFHRRPINKLWDYFKTKLASVATSGSYTDLSNKPTALKNPNVLTFTGGATGDYDGSTPKTVNIPRAPDLTPYMKKTADSDLDMQDRSILMGPIAITSDDGFSIDAAGGSINILGGGIYFNKSPLDTRANNQKLYAPQVSPTFTGTVTAPNVTVSTSLTIPGGKIWIA